MMRNFDRQFPLRARLVAHRFKLMKTLGIVLALLAGSALAQEPSSNYAPPCGPGLAPGALCSWPGGYEIALTGYGASKLDASEHGKTLEPERVIPGLRAVVLVDTRAVPAGWTLRRFVAQIGVSYSDCTDPGWAWSGHLFGAVFCPQEPPAK